MELGGILVKGLRKGNFLVGHVTWLFLGSDVRVRKF